MMSPRGKTPEVAFGERTTGVTTPRTALLGTPTGELVLRICGGEHDGRVLRIQAAKCLIGSGAGCTLRLRARHIRPVHVLILRGPRGAVVRCWSPDVLLNERAVQEAALSTGDVLQIGPIKLHVDQINGLDVAPAQDRIEDGSNFKRTNRQPSKRRKQLFRLLRHERQQHAALEQTIASQRVELSTLQAQLAHVPANVVNQNDDELTLQLSRTIEQLQEELAAAAKRRSLEQQSTARQRQSFDEQLQQRLQLELNRQREQLQTEYARELNELRGQLAAQKNNSAASSAQAAALEQVQHELVATRDEKQTLLREIDSLKLALQTKISSEELARHSAAAQVEQLSRAFELVRQERDDLFERLHTEQQHFDEQVARWQAQIDDARASAQAQLSLGEAAAQKQLAIVRSELAGKDAQLAEVQQQASDRLTRLQDESRQTIAELKAQLAARSDFDESRRSSDAQRIAQLNATIERLQSEATADAGTRQQQQDGFTIARKRLEAEIAALTNRLKQSDQALHEMRQNSGQVQAEVLAEAERARAERDAVREQMLRQQQDWTDFRSRLEAAGTEERALAALKYEQLQSELTTALAERNQLRVVEGELQKRAQIAQAELTKLREENSQLAAECEQAVAAQIAAEGAASGRVQQMTISMENLHLERANADADIEQERSDWQSERDALAQCIAELQQEISTLNKSLADAEEQARLSTVDSQSRAQAAEQQLELAQSQVAEWQAAAEQARCQADELSKAIAKFRQQEQLWQIEREQLDFSQQTSNERLQQLEVSITELQEQLTQAQESVACAPAVPGNSAERLNAQEDICSTINVNNQELAALQEQMATPVPSQFSAPDPQEDIGSTINVNNQELAALHEQMGAHVPSLLAPREMVDSSELQARAAELKSQAEALERQQAQLEEDQAVVARQRIELEQFQASLRELEESLHLRAEQLAQSQSTPPASDAPAEHNTEHPSSYSVGDHERESDSISESEAFAAMADQVANLYRTPSPRSSRLSRPADESQSSPQDDDPYATPGATSQSAEGASADEAASAQDAEVESLIIATPAESSEEHAQLSVSSGPAFDSSSPIIGPSDEDFESQLDARVARVMGGDNSWNPAESQPKLVEPGASEERLEQPLSQSDAVNNVLGRLREAGLWKGEGTAKSAQFPSSDPPVDDSAAVCRVSELGPVGHDASANEQPPEPQSKAAEDGLDQLVSRPASNNLLKTPGGDESEADDSIESYMSRLMQRLRTDADDKPQDVRKSTGRSTASFQSRATSAPAEPPPPSKPVDVTPLTCLSELAPRSQAPEMSANLAAMRELANSAARGAIELHQQKSGKQRLTTRTIQIVIAVLAAGGLVFWWWRSNSLMALGGAGLCLIWMIAVTLLAGRRRSKDPKSTPTSEATPQ